MKMPLYFRAALIGQAAQVNGRTIRRRARAEGWPRRRHGNAFEFIPPARLKAKTMAAWQKAAGGKLESFEIGPAIVAEQFRTEMRSKCLCALSAAIPVYGVEKALERIARDFSFRVSKSSLRAWCKRFAESGIRGLKDNRRGHSGRKPKNKPLNPQ